MSRLCLLTLGGGALPAPVAEAVTRWSADGHEVALVTLHPRPTPEGVGPVVRLAPLPPAPATRAPAPAAAPPAAEGAAAPGAAVPGAAVPAASPAPTDAVGSPLRRVARVLRVDPRRWLGAALSWRPRARAVLTGADVVLVVDPSAVLTGWLLAHGRPDRVVRTVPGVDRLLR